jgi:adenylosuccinate lyase
MIEIMSDERMSAESFELDALSPLDGRYAREMQPLRGFFSEFAFLRERVRVEIDYLLALARDTHLIRPVTEAEEKILRAVVEDFTFDEARRIKALERSTRHDVKALEYYLRGQLASTSLADLIEWVHFGLTSEDVNQTAQALALRNSRDAVLLPALDGLLARLVALAREYRATPMLARTHGQAAVPTTLGKEFAVFFSRLKKLRALLHLHRFEAKFSGAVGNSNALVSAAPQVDWLEFGARFIRSLGLEPNLLTTQLMPYDNWVRYFDALRLTNSILLDLAQDAWRYISDDYLSLRVVANEVGSSTMPQKVNPIDLENAEGNLGIANALFAHYAQKLPISRLQRDLSDSTVRRTFGVALGHTLLACLNLRRGLETVQANEARLHTDLEAHWEVLAEGSQTILRSAGVADAYETLKTLTRGKTLTRREFDAWVSSLHVDELVKVRLRALTPFSYIGLAEKLVERALEEE